MCGIVGQASFKNLDYMSTWIPLALKEIEHRGPDDVGSWLSKDKKVEFGHRRLSVIDTTKSGSQPMYDSNSEISIIFNGEIYNFKILRDELISLGHNFRTKSDTEVIIASYKQWNIDCLKKFEGMFAFALYDQKKNNVFIARDRAGEKPFFYSIINDNFLFASEIKALIKNNKISKKINKTSLDCYLAFGYVPNPDSIFKDIFKLEPGSFLLFNTIDGKIIKKKYWQLPENNHDSFKNYDEKELIEEFKFLFEDSVAKQLQADVPIGVLLSGGLDSSLITAIASGLNKNLKTFSIIFPGDDKFNESIHVNKISNFYGTNHNDLEAQSITPELINKLAKQFDEPIIDSSMIPTFLICQEVKKHCTVVLGGDGADELFGGYNHYSRLSLLKQLTGWVPPKIKKNFSRIISNLLHEDLKGQNWLNSFEYDYNLESPLIANYFNPKRRKKLIGYELLHGELNAEKIRRIKSNRSNCFLERITRTDFDNYLVEDILVKVDRASMINSLEVRAPFLDYRIIEFAFSKLPSKMKINLFNKKVFLQKFGKQILPQNFSFGRKKGFTIPINKYLQEKSIKEFTYDTLTSTECIFELSSIQKILGSNYKGYNNGEKIFGLLMFELWRRFYGAELECI